MLIKLVAPQIPDYWEIIKSVATTVDEIDEDILQPYLNELLHALLNDKAHCFVKLNDDNYALWLGIVRISHDKIIHDKYLYIQCLYAFEKTDLKEWAKDWAFVEQFARKEGCSYISFHSRNRRIWEIGQSVGFNEDYRVFKLKL